MKILVLGGLFNFRLQQSVQPKAKQHRHHAKASHYEPVGRITKMPDNFESHFRTQDMGKAKTHGVQSHIASFLPSWRSSHRKGIRKREGKNLAKSHEYNAYSQNAHPNINQQNIKTGDHQQGSNKNNFDSVDLFSFHDADQRHFEHKNQDSVQGKQQSGLKFGHAKFLVMKQGQSGENLEKQHRRRETDEEENPERFVPEN